MTFELEIDCRFQI